MRRPRNSDDFRLDIEQRRQRRTFTLPSGIVPPKELGRTGDLAQSGEDIYLKNANGVWITWVGVS